MQPIILPLIVLMLFAILLKSVYELYKPENKSKRKQINESVQQIRRNRELIQMPDKSYYCKN